MDIDYGTFPFQACLDDEEIILFGFVTLSKLILQKWQIRIG